MSANADIIFQDDFNDGVADGWIESSPDWTVEDGQYRVYISGYVINSTSQIANSENWSNYTLEFDVIRTEGVSFTLVFRNIFFGFRTGRTWDGGHNYCFLNGEIVGEFTFPLNVWHQIKVLHTGNNIKFYIKQKDDQNYLLLHDLDRYSSGPIKLRAWTGHRALIGYNIDNVNHGSIQTAGLLNF